MIVVRHLMLAIFIWCLVSCATKTSEHASNRLSKASSPYLREHADNPVDWYEWGDEALSKSQREGKPLIVSIGYASCHWCHVMEAETFMDTAVARVMNENFVCIKVDREERPDIDQIYINAAQLISGNAGWPLNAFALPDGRPFFAATYFPKPQWLQLLKQVAETYASDEQALRRQAAAVTKGIKTLDEFALIDSTTTARIDAESIYANWYPYFDRRYGGLSGAPKFPMPVIWESVLQHYHLTGDTLALNRTISTLDEMSSGGIYDHLGGGFARYSTDSLWRIPHFEKMLYDNAQLVSVYAQAFKITGDQRYEKIVRGTLDFIGRELRSQDGGFFSSINADSEGEEGKFYVWSKQEIDKLLDNRSAMLVSKVFNVTAEGNWEAGKNVLFKKPSPALPHADEEVLENACKTLLSRRNKRIKPTTDEKILTSWNALTIEGYLHAYTAFGNREYLEGALKCATFLEKNRVDNNGHVWRVSNEGHPSIEGFLDDYAFLARAYIQLYQCTFDIHFLTVARSILDYAISNFYDAQSELYYFSLDKSARQIASKIEVADEVVPSSNAVFADVLYLLSEYFQNDGYREKYDAMLRRVSEKLDGNGPYYASWVRLAERESTKPYEVAIIGPEAEKKRKLLSRHYLPTAILLGGQAENLPLLENKLLAGKTMIYVCRDRTCKLPVEDVGKAVAQMK
ncbi:MAG TPA: thioredoxin domain-containing protein [Chryseolinea sp.]|nr:thioredoxin domain-containing protein [Chryseolinea sp.]